MDGERGSHFSEGETEVQRLEFEPRLDGLHSSIPNCLLLPPGRCKPSPTGAGGCASC